MSSLEPFRALVESLAVPSAGVPIDEPRGVVAGHSQLARVHAVLAAVQRLERNAAPVVIAALRKECAYHVLHDAPTISPH